MNQRRVNKLAKAANQDLPANKIYSSNFQYLQKYLLSSLNRPLLQALQGMQ